MPAWIVVLWIGKIPLPLPWFLLWIILLPLILLAMIAGTLARLVDSCSRWGEAMQESWRILLLLICLHGLKVDVRSADDMKIGLRFI